MSIYKDEVKPKLTRELRLRAGVRLRGYSSHLRFGSGWSLYRILGDVLRE